MKKIVIYTVILGLTFYSCSDYLDREPPDQLNTSEFWETEEDFNQALTGVYGSLQTGYFSQDLPSWDNLTDNSYGDYDYTDDGGGLTATVARGNIDPTTGGIVSRVYEDAYIGISRANRFLKELSSTNKDLDIPKNEMEAEARMIRAYFYSFLYRVYGEIPIIKEPLDLDTQHQPKSSLDEVYEFMMDDLDFAIANLSDVNYSAANGHWTKNAALAYKARMILYTAYDSSGKPIPDKMREAWEELESIKGYTLAEDFSSNFRDLEQDSSPEIMMSVRFLAPDNATSADLKMGDGYYQPLANFIDAFENLDGTKHSTPTPYEGNGVINSSSFNNDSLQNNRDPRLAKTVFIEEYLINGVGYKNTNYLGTVNTLLGKFMSTNLEPRFSYSTNSQQDWVIMRFADVLLMKAEIANEIFGPEEASEFVNQIRNRAGMPDLSSGLSKDEMRVKIRHERRVELAFEGERYFDLKRWRIAEEVLNNLNDGIYTHHFEKKHYLWPIPQDEIDKNKGVLEQNPDY